MPPRTAQVAVGIGFVLGTWALVNGLHMLITGAPVVYLGHIGPWGIWGETAALLGAGWMAAGNWCLLQNSPVSWTGLGLMMAISTFGAGRLGMAILLTQAFFLAAAAWQARPKAAAG